MKNLIKIFSVILMITIGVIAWNCQSKTDTTGTSDSTQVVDSLGVVAVDTVSVVDTTKVSGGAVVR